VLTSAPGSFTYLGNGDGTFTVKGPYDVGAGGRAVAADVNADGRLDLILARYYGAVPEQLSVLLGTGTAPLGPPGSPGQRRILRKESRSETSTGMGSWTLS